MMVEETKKMMDLIDETMELLNKFMDLSMLEEMDEDTFKMTQLYLKIMNQSKDYAMKQAEFMDDQARKLDLILSKLEES